MEPKGLEALDKCPPCRRGDHGACYDGDGYPESMFDDWRPLFFCQCDCG